MQNVRQTEAAFEKKKNLNGKTNLFVFHWRSIFYVDDVVLPPPRTRFFEIRKQEFDERDARAILP